MLISLEYPPVLTSFRGPVWVGHGSFKSRLEFGISANSPRCCLFGEMTVREKTVFANTLDYEDRQSMG